MIPQNKINQKEEPQQSRLVDSIKAYLSSRFFQTAAHFESRTHMSLPYLDFQLAKMPSRQPQPVVDTRAIGLLVGGFNRNVKITAQLIRTIQFDYKVYCLAWDKFQQSEARFFPIAIIFPNAAHAEQWCHQICYLSIINVYEPYVNFNSYYKGAFLVARYDCVEIFPNNALLVKEWEGAKSMANESFRRKDYKLAVMLYEVALGLLWKQSKSKDRAILHSNIAQTFFEMALNENTLLYANIAIILDHTSVKSYYRKFCSLLELQKYEKIPDLMALMANFCSKEEFTTAHERYTRYMANKTGIYNWTEIISKRSYVFGEYINLKLKHTLPNEDRSRHRKFAAGALINKYQLVAVQKFLIYFEEKNGVKRKNTFMRDFFDNTYDYLQLEHRFSEKIKEMLFELGKKVEVEGEINKVHYTHASAAILQSQCLKTIFRNQNSVAVCPDFTRFQIDENTPNCTLLNLNGACFYFAMRDIQPNELLSIQLFNKTIDSPHPSFQQFENSGKGGIDAYYFYKATLLEKKMYNTCVRYLWSVFRGQTNKTKVTHEILEIIEYFPQWELVILILSSLQNDRNFPLKKRCKEVVEHAFEKFFKMQKEQAHEIITTLIND